MTEQVISADAIEQRVIESRIDTETNDWSQRVSALTIHDQATLDHAGSYLHSIKALMAAIDTECDPNIKAAYALHRDLCAQKKRFAAPLVAARTEINGKVKAYTAECQRKAREQAALEEAVRREAQEKADADAAELAALGDHELARAIQDEAEADAAPAQVAPIERTAGVSVREHWRAEVTDIGALVTAVAEGTVPLAAISPNMKIINQSARALKSELRWPGVRVWNERTVATR